MITGIVVVSSFSMTAKANDIQKKVYFYIGQAMRKPTDCPTVIQIPQKIS